MTRAVHILRQIATALSLLLFAATATFWVRSHVVPIPVGRVTLRGTTYDLRADRGRVTASPRLVGPAEEVGAAWERLYETQNDRLAWHVLADRRPERGTATELDDFRLYPGGLSGWMNDGWLPVNGRYTSAENLALLRALDDPDRFVAAHVLLARTLGPRPPDRWEPRGDGSLVFNWVGLRVRCPTLTADRAVERFRELTTRGRSWSLPDDWVVEPGQQGGLRDLWQSRLAPPVGSAPLWPPAVVFALAPAAWARSCYARGRRRRAGRCPACGYDCRATPGRCPECGAVPAGAAP